MKSRRFAATTASATPSPRWCRRVDGFTIIGGSLIYSGRQQIADLALQHRVPGIHFLHDYARAGLLASYGPSLFDMYRRSAGYVDKIYKGAKPADLPVEQPSKFELVINLKTAKHIDDGVRRMRKGLRMK